MITFENLEKWLNAPAEPTKKCFNANRDESLLKPETL